MSCHAEVLHKSKDQNQTVGIFMYLPPPPTPTSSLFTPFLKGSAVTELHTPRFPFLIRQGMIEDTTFHQLSIGWDIDGMHRPLRHLTGGRGQRVQSWALPFPVRIRILILGDAILTIQALHNLTQFTPLHLRPSHPTGPWRIDTQSAAVRVDIHRIGPRTGARTTASLGARDDRRTSDGATFAVGVLVRAFMLLHIVLPRKRLSARWAQDVLLARVFFPMPSCVA